MMKKEEKTAVYGGVAFLIVLVLGVWWLSASVQTGFFDTNTASTTSSTNSTTNTKSSASAPKSTGTTAPKKLTGAASVASEVANGTTFASLLSSTGVDSEIQSGGTYTIFVPTDGAFARLPAGTISNMSAAQKKRLVEYHVIVGRAVDVHANIAGVVLALSKDPLNFTVNADKSVSVGNAKILDTYKASNGIVYTIDTALLPPQVNSAFLIK